MFCVRKPGRRSPDFGVAYPVVDAWRASVEGELAARKIGRSDLARAIDVSPTAITHVLEGKYKSSSLVAPISRYLLLPIPSLVDDDDVGLQRWISVGVQLRERNPEMFDSLLKAAAAAIK